MSAAPGDSRAEQAGATHEGEEVHARGATQDNGEASEDGADSSDGGDGRNAEEAAHATTPTGRWAFMDPFVECWFRSLKKSTVDGDVGRRELLYATELVAYMLRLDRKTWWYAKRLYRPWFETYDPSKYDELELVPTMTFAMSPVLRDGDDAAAKKRLLEKEDRHRRLRGFKIPVRIKMQPPDPDDAEALRLYLRDGVAAVRDFKHKCDTDVTTPFHFESVSLHVYLVFLGDVHAELRELMSLGVPVKVKLRYNYPTDWPSAERANVFPAFANDPGSAVAVVDDGASHHTLDSTRTMSSYELWSALAYSSNVRKVVVQPTEYGNQPLVYVGFEISEEDLDAMEAVAAPEPSSLAPGAPRAPSASLIRLKPDTVISWHPGGEINGSGYDENHNKVAERQSLTELGISSDWQFPVVTTIDATGAIQLIIPGHGICEAPLTSVASHDDCAPISQRRESALTSLTIDNHSDETGITGRFVSLVGRKLQELRWDGGSWGTEHGIVFDDDLAAIVRASPRLEKLTVQETTLHSLAPLGLMGLRELRLQHMGIPMAEVITLFHHLRDSTSPIAKSLQRFTYDCPLAQLSQEGVDAAVTMLAQNRRLHSVTLGLEAAVFDANEQRFRPARSVHVTVERLAMPEKLAFLSVVQHFYKEAGSASALGQLDSGCIATVFQCLRCVATRRIRLLKG